MTSYEEWRVTGRWGEEPYEFVWSPIGNVTRACGFDTAEIEARNFVDAMRENQVYWADGPHLHRRTVTVTEWEEAD
ncbi:hypothetical protein ACFQS1_19800 [Paractinoplanes rhizophilus]|uniref:Uncharacterized protein n=1 Tax=Paractinoplanes rhizophilus TaxID=1416877 RepID=A0ABW2HT05_9ACTN